MSLTKNYEYSTVGNLNQILPMKTNTVGTLYKGAIASVADDGYVKGASDTANEYPVGLVKKKVVTATGEISDVEVEVGLFWLPMAGASQGFVGKKVFASADDTLTTNPSAANIPLGVIMAFRTGEVLFDTRQKVGANAII